MFYGLTDSYALVALMGSVFGTLLDPLTWVCILMVSYLAIKIDTLVASIVVAVIIVTIKYPTVVETYSAYEQQLPENLMSHMLWNGFLSAFICLINISFIFKKKIVKTMKLEI